ncbi:MAG: hypothetical protein IKZ45_01720 [Fibrobacter sp.]|nr:hypothetical protein [Fibrobacter sp.]
MFYKHWKKIALALTGLFWASCGDSASSSNDCAECEYGVPYTRTRCYNDTVQNDEGHTFKIIDCTDGNKYMRSPNEANTDATLPEGVKVFAPQAGSEQALNCTSHQDVCIERNPEKTIEQDSLAGCHPVIDCPEKTEK